MIKNILKDIWKWFICVPHPADELLYTYTLLPPTTKPTISKEEQDAINQSKKILDIVLKDLEKYPPHEWKPGHTASYISPYSHPCISYNLNRISPYRDLDYMVPENISCLIKSDASLLWKSFEEKLVAWKKQQQAIKDAKAMEDFLDDDKRILCKDTTND